MNVTNQLQTFRLNCEVSIENTALVGRQNIQCVGRRVAAEGRTWKWEEEIEGRVEALILQVQGELMK